MKIYGVSASPFVRKVIVTCEIKALKYSIVPISPFGEQPPEAFKKISPLGKIPVLKNGDFVLADSSVICSYLEEKYPQNSILPKSIEDRACARWLEEYSGSKLFEVVVVKLFFERFVKPNLLKKPTDEKVVEENLKRTLPPVMDYLESHMPETGFLFSSDKLSIADIAIGSNMVNAAYADYQVDAEKWPKLSSYIKRIHQTPAFKKALALDSALFNK